MFDTFKPFGNRIVVRISKEEHVTSGGIFMPVSDSDNLQKGIVTAAGEGNRTPSGKLIPLRIKEGDKVYFNAFTGTEIDPGLRIMHEDEIFGYIRS